MTSCSNCGNEISEGYSFCGSCGTQVTQAPTPQQNYHYPYPYYPPPPIKDSSSTAVVVIFIVIAVVVIVTIILAAVLYVMVIGFGGEYFSTPNGSWTSVEATSDTSGTLTFGTFDQDVMPLDLIIHVEKDGESAGYIQLSNSYTSATALSWIDRPDSSSAIYYDYNYMGNEVNTGDYIELNGLSPGTTYSFTVEYAPLGEIIWMNGDVPVFTTHP